MIRSRCVELLTSTHLELSRNPRLIFKDGFEVRLTGKWVSDHGAQGDDGNPFVLTHFFNYRPRDKAMAAFVKWDGKCSGNLVLCCSSTRSQTTLDITTNFQ